MGFHRKPFSLLLLSMVFFTSLELIPLAESAIDYATPVYRAPALQALSGPNTEQALSALFKSLVSQATKAKFFKTNFGTGQNTITGLFQCRGDLSTSDCYNCVSKLRQICSRCSRIQLRGCYFRYEVPGLSQNSGIKKMLRKTCGPRNVGVSGFEERRDTAFSAMESGMISGHGFCNTSHESVYVLGQCEGDVGDADCSECVKSAVQRAQAECGSSISGQIYLQKCFISYGYDPNGVPRRSSPVPSSSSSSSSGTGTNTRKAVGIAVGGAMALGFVAIYHFAFKRFDGTRWYVKRSFYGTEKPLFGTMPPYLNP